MATLRPRGNAWQLCWWEGGKERRLSLGEISKGEAEKLRGLKTKELARQRAAGVVQLPRAGLGAGPLFSDYAAEYLDWRETEFPDSHFRIEAIVRRHLSPYFGGYPMGGITSTLIEAYIKRRRRTPTTAPRAKVPHIAKAATIVKELRTLSAMLNRAVEKELIHRNPMGGVKAPQLLDSKPPRYYTTQELEQIYLADPPYAPIWRLMANTGLRRKEAQQLQWEHVGPGAIRVLSTAKARTKSGRWRLIPLSEGALAALAELEAVKDGDYCLPRHHGSSLTRTFRLALKRAKLDGSLHCLRHTFCSHLVMRGTHMRTVQVLAGHATIKTTEQYSHLAPGFLEESVRGLHL